MTLKMRPSWKVWFLAGMVVLVAAVIMPLIRKAVYSAGTSARLQHIKVAVDLYFHNHGCYPPQYLTDKQGKPAHSWRVLVLPYLGYEELYSRYRFDEPWNGPHNKLLASEMPEEYRSPFLDSKSTITQYVGVVGNDTPWQGATPTHFDDLFRAESDPLIWFAEVANSDINWMEPRDIPLEQAVRGINVPGGIQSNYSDELPVQLMPYNRKWVPSDIPREDFRKMLTVSENHANKSPPSKPDAAFRTEKRSTKEKSSVVN